MGAEGIWAFVIFFMSYHPPTQPTSHLTLAPQCYLVREIRTWSFYLAQFPQSMTWKRSKFDRARFHCRKMKLQCQTDSSSWRIAS